MESEEASIDSGKEGRASDGENEGQTGVLHTPTQEDLPSSQSSQSILTTPNDHTPPEQVTSLMSSSQTLSTSPPISSSCTHNLSLQSICNCADHPTAPYIRVTKVAFSVVKEVENKILEKESGRVLDQACEQVSDQPFKTEFQFEHLMEIPPPLSTSALLNSSVQQPVTPFPTCFASPSFSSSSIHTPIYCNKSEAPYDSRKGQESTRIPLVVAGPLPASLLHSEMPIVVKE